MFPITRKYISISQPKLNLDECKETFLNLIDDSDLMVKVKNTIKEEAERIFKKLKENNMEDKIINKIIVFNSIDGKVYPVIYNNLIEINKKISDKNYYAWIFH
jgi:hypothetical protein